MSERITPPRRPYQGVAEEPAIYRAHTVDGGDGVRAARAAHPSVQEAARYVIATHKTALKNLERR
jgi:hypothetical protein